MINIIFLAIISAGIILCVLRMLLGPTSTDRVMALDTVSTVTISLLVFLGFIFRRYIYLDVSLVYAVLTFIGVIAIARFLEKGI